MKRYLKHIVLSLVTVLLTVSCLEEMQAPQPVFESEELTLVPRVKSFTNQYVTKAEGDEAAYTQAETKITHLAYLIFDSNGALVHMAEADVQNGAGLTLNKTNLNSSETAATVVMFANVNLADIKKANSDGTFTAIGNTLTLDEFDDYGIHLTSAPVVLSTDLSDTGFKGFPMKGVAEGVNLTTSSKDHIVVSLQILYAKINFDISVAAGTENQNYEGVTPSFTLSGYSVTNVPTSTPVKTLNDDETLGDIESTPSGTIYEHTGTESDPSKTVSLNGTSASTFTFYMAESRYNHGGTDGVYPANLPDENKQQYKPQLATTGTGSPATGLATYVKVNGTYIDYRGTSWTVNYKVYLGKNSYDNFHVDRNSEYKNYLTIKGIRNNDSYTDAGSVWIDHRVDVSTDDPSKHITITRETLIDSHIEVRPLRVKWDGDTYAGVRVYLPTESNGSLVSWIGIERFTGENCLDGSTYCYVYDSSTKQNVAIGKRRYFTTTLISELQSKGGEFGVQTDDNGKKFINLHNGDCVWIYFDENTTSSVRPADIKLEFYKSDGSTVEETYQVKQSALQTVGGVSIESYEEYLHTYDSIDKYNLSTSPIDYTQQGIVWGFSGTQISKNDLVSAVSLPDWAVGILNLDFTNAISQRYDFIHSDDGDYSAYTKKSGDWEKYSELGTGRNFTSRASETMGITIIDMATMPNNAYQYCLSKNKFKEDADGKHTMEIHWYLPDVHELQCIFNAAKVNNTSADLNTSSSYWSSQPSFTSVMPDALDGINLISENSASTRAVSVNGISDASRSLQNRIRCAYSAKAIHADMSNRAPEGMGGNFSFWMKAWADWSSRTPGYFSSYPVEKNKEPEIVPYKLLDTYAYPKTSADANQYFGAYLIADGVEWGFEEDPSEPKNWDTEDVSIYTSQVALHKWPGLTTQNVVTEETSLLSGRQEYYVLEGTKQETKSTTTTHYKECKNTLSTGMAALQANPNLTISFSAGNNSRSPEYEYYKTTKTVRADTTRTWVTPKYQKNNRTVTTPFSLRTPGGQIQLTSEQQAQYDAAINYTFLGVGYKKSRQNNSDGYIYATEAEAIAAGKSANSAVNSSGASVSIPEGVKRTVTAEKSSGDLLLYTYYTQAGSRYKKEVKGVRYRYRIAYSTAVTTSYYTYLKDGNWTETTKSSEPENTDPPTTDELRVYCGNSFTISVGGDYEITKVKVYCSGNNYIRGTDGIHIPIVNYDIPQKYYYARFVDSSLTLPSAENTPLTGMDYEGDFGENSSIHIWSGSGKSSVTLKLADYFCEAYFDASDIGQSLFQGKFDMNNILKFVPYDYKYVAPTSEDFSKSIVIDRIEVKCTKKATAATE